MLVGRLLSFLQPLLTRVMLQAARSIQARPAILQIVLTKKYLKQGETNIICELSEVGGELPLTWSLVTVARAATATVQYCSGGRTGSCCPTEATGWTRQTWDKSGTGDKDQESNIIRWQRQKGKLNVGLCKNGDWLIDEALFCKGPQGYYLEGLKTIK